MSEKAMDKFDEIWFFVERKLNTPIPTYFKNILKVCGYNNAITIASIEEDDVTYFESEVRNGNVKNYFEGKDTQIILEGSTKTMENFEFSRGHKKFLLFIVDFLKTLLGENGPDSIILEEAPKPVKTKVKAKERVVVVPSKKRKYSESSVHSPNSASSLNAPIEEHDGLRSEISILLSKALMSLIRHTPAMYVKARVKDIEMAHTKMSTDLVRVEIDKPSSEEMIDEVDEETIRYVGNIACPFCLKIMHVSHSFIQRKNCSSGKPWWNTSNFDLHLRSHQNYLDFESEEQRYERNIRTQQPLLEEVGILETKENTTAINGMLQNFLDSAERNFPRKKPGYRHDNVIKMFAAFIKMIAGLLAYETLHANFPLSLPSVSTVNRFIVDNGPQIIEGEMRTDELVQYLQIRNLPLRVSLSEDGTRITAKVSYDPNTNQLIGFALPLDVNGMPVTSSFPARNVSEIQKHFLNTSNFISSTAYVVMAQPIEQNSSPFCLNMFLTDSKFTAYNILKRWKFQARKLKEKGINIDNISTDGDSRTLKAMKCLSQIGISNPSFLDCEWFSCGGYVETTFTQDITHIITKLRNLFLKYSRIFPLGNKIISSSYLKYLIDNISKDKHSLNRTDIEPKDRQNFLSAEKLCSEKTIQCLLDFVPGSEGTALYLKAMNSALTAFLNIKIKSEVRIYLIWYSVFFFRAWRSWLLNSEKLKSQTKTRSKSYYNLKENFISSNCYTCIELNAHALVKKVLMEDSGEEDRSNIFFPDLYGSQPCESTFRKARSFTSTFSTVVNCNMLDIVHRIKKIQLQDDIIHNCNGEIKFPRFDKKTNTVSDLLEDADCHRFVSLARKIIISEIERARKAVICDMEKLGIDSSKLNFHCQVKPVLEEDVTEIDSDPDTDEWDTDSEEMAREMELRHELLDEIENEADIEIQEDINSLSGITGELILKDYRDVSIEDNIHLDEKIPFVVVVDNTGKEMVVRKSSVCWLLSKDKFKLSSDRLQRVQEKEYTNRDTNNSENNVVISADGYAINKEIAIGEWCIFSEDASENIHEENPKILLGLVLGFSYLNKKTFKDREYSKSCAPVESNSNKGVGILCTSYNFNASGELTIVLGDKHKYTRIESYIGTIKQPMYTNKILTISEKLVLELQKLSD